MNLLVGIVQKFDQESLYGQHKTTKLTLTGKHTLTSCKSPKAIPFLTMKTKNQSKDQLDRLVLIRDI